LGLQAGEKIAIRVEDQGDRVDPGDVRDPADEQRLRNVDRRHEEEHEDRELHQRPRLQRAQAQGDPAGEEEGDDVDGEREGVETGDVGAIPASSATQVTTLQVTSTRTIAVSA